MKVLSVALSVCLLAGALFASAPVGAKGKKNKKQKVEGVIAAPAPFPADPNSCYSGLHRRLAIFGGDAVSGPVGYSFSVSKKTWKKPFVLKVTGGEGVDLDMTYYTEYGTPEQAADPAYAPPSQSFEKRAPGGETGIVPKGFKKVIVCMQSGAGATFTYTAGKGVKKK